jgi:hypothetical protein
MKELDKTNKVTLLKPKKTGFFFILLFVIVIDFSVIVP